MLMAIVFAKRALDYFKVKEHLEDAIDVLQDQYEDAMGRLNLSRRSSDGSRVSGWESRLGTPRSLASSTGSRTSARAGRRTSTRVSARAAARAEARASKAHAARLAAEAAAGLEDDDALDFESSGGMGMSEPSIALKQMGSRLFRKASSARVDPLEAERLQPDSPTPSRLGSYSYSQKSAEVIRARSLARGRSAVSMENEKEGPSFGGAGPPSLLKKLSSFVPGAGAAQQHRYGSVERVSIGSCDSERDAEEFAPALERQSSSLIERGVAMSCDDDEDSPRGSMRI